MQGEGLTYRGYDIYALAEHACFEEVAHLHHYGHLSNTGELADYRDKLIRPVAEYTGPQLQTWVPLGERD